MHSGNFNFIYCPKKEFEFLKKKKYSQYLMKWSLEGNIKVKFYNFNEKFLPALKQDFVDSFFTDPQVYPTLETMDSGMWHKLDKKIEKVTFEHIPSTIVSMCFFDKIRDNSEIVNGKEGYLISRYEDEINGFAVSDNLRSVLVDPDSEYYKIYSENERKEFIFQLFTHLCLGGEYCQQEITIQPYLDITRDMYKELLSVQKSDNVISVRSMVLRITAFDSDKIAVIPRRPENVQNFAYLIIDDFKRQVTFLSHQYGYINI